MTPTACNICTCAVFAITSFNFGLSTCFVSHYCYRRALYPGGGGGNSHMKQMGMLVVSLWGVNFGFWSRLGCSGQSANILSHQGLV